MNRTTKVLGIILIVFLAIALVSFCLIYVFDGSGKSLMGNELLSCIVFYFAVLASIPLLIAFLISWIIYRMKRKKMEVGK